MIVVISPSLLHVMMNARMPTTGSVNSSAPSRGYRPDTSATATMTAAEMTTLRRVQIMGFDSIVVVSPVWFFLEVAGVRRAIDYACHRAGVLLDDAKTLVIADVT